MSFLRIGALRTVVYSRNLCLMLVPLLAFSVSVALAQATSGPVSVAPAIRTFAGMQSSPGYSGDSGPATSATMQIQPYGGVATDGAGNVYIADDANNRIRMVPAASGTYFGQTMTAGYIYTIAGNGTAGYSGNGGLATNAKLNAPQNMTVDQAGNLYIADTNNHVIRMVPAVSGPYFGQPTMTVGYIYTIAGNGTNGYANGPATTAAEMNVINGVAVDTAGNLYIADGSPNNAIRMVPAKSGYYFGSLTLMQADTMYTIAGTNVGGYSGDGGPATSAELNNPADVTVDNLGNVYFSDYSNNRARMVPAVSGPYFGQTMTVGYIYTIAGDGLSGSSGDGGPATSAELNGPKGVALDSAGNLYISDINNNRIRMVAAASGTYFGQTVTADDIYTVAGDGTGGYTGDGGLPTIAELKNPYGVALDGVGNLYIADTYNSVVRKVAPATEFPVTAVGATSVAQNVLVQFTNAAYVSGFTVPKTQTQSQPGAQEFTVGTVSGCTLGNLSAGTTCTVPVTFSPQDPGLRFGALEAINGTNAIVGTVGLTGIGTGPLGLFQPGTANVVSTGTYAPLNNVGGVAVAPTGDLYISDSGNNRVVEVSATGTASLVSTGSVALSEPIGLAVDSAGNLYIANTNSNRIVEVTAEGVASVVNLGSLTLNQPIGLAEDAAGDLYIADRGNNRIVKVSAAGVASVVNTGSLILNWPNGVGVDSTGDLFIADRNNNRIVEVTASGASSVVVSSTTQFGGTTLNQPTSVAVDSAGNLYITDLSNNRLVEYSATGVASVITTGSTSLTQPHDLVLDGAGDVYIANWGNGSGTYTAVKVNLTQGALAFASSNMGVQSSDSPKSATLQNAGNTTLSIYDLATVTTSQTSNSFNLDGSTTTCGNGMGLNPADTCVVGVDFVPLDAGALTGFANITDNNLNAVGPNYVVQPIVLNGTGNDNMATIALTENPGASVSYGTAVTVTATLSGSNGTPTGSITYTLDNVLQPSQPGMTLTTSGSNGVATFSLSGTLSVGTHSVMVGYAGDNNYTANQQGFTLTVHPDTTTTGLSANPTSAVYGTSVTLTATVTNTSASPTTLVPTGTETFYAGATALGTGTVTNGVATLTTSALPAGTDSLTAKYVASTDYASSTSGPVSVTVSPSPTAGDVLAIDTGYTGPYVSTMLAFQPDEDFTGGSGVFSSTNPINITNAINAAPMSIYQSERYGVGTYTIPNLVPGSTYTVRLHFAEIYFTKVGQRIFNVGINGTPVLTNFDIVAAAGGPNIAIVEPFEATANSSGNIVINFTDGTANVPKISGIEILASQPSTTTLTPASGSYGASVTLTATVNGTGFTPSGTVVFSNNGIPIGTGMIVTTGSVSTATLTTKALPTGTNTITATYQGVGNFGPSTSTPATVTINQAPPAITWAAPAAISYGTALSGTQLDATSTTTGSFTYSPALGTVLSAGTHTLTATFTPTDTSDYSTGTTTVTLTVNPATLTVTANNASRLYGAANPTLTGTVTGAMNGDTFTESFSTTATPSSPIGSYPIVPSVAGANLLDYTVTPANGTLMVSTALSATSLLVSTQAITVGQSVTLTATVTAAGVGGAPVTSGTVNFVTGSILLGSASVGANGVAMLATTNLPVGAGAITASYVATTDYTASNSSLVTVTVSPVPAPVPAATTTTLVSSSSAITAGQSVNLIATVMAGSAPVPSGTVTFASGSTSIGAAQLSASGQATLTTTNLPAGTDNVTATFVASASDAASTSSPVQVMVSAAPAGTAAATTTTLTASVSNITAGQSVNLIATVMVGSSPVTSGTVTFASGSTSIGAAQLSARGQATLTTTNLPAGSDSVTASFVASANDAASTSTAVAVTVTGSTGPSGPSGPTITMALSSSALSVAAGASTTDTVTVTPVGGYIGTLQFSCANLPISATCTFTPNPVIFTASGSAQTVTLSIQTIGKTGTTAVLRPYQPMAETNGSLPMLATVFWMPGWLLASVTGLRKKTLGGNSARARHLLVLLVLLAGVGMMTACGGSTASSAPATSTPTSPTSPIVTPSGTYTVQVVVIGTGNLAQVVPVSLTVQ